MGKILIKRSDVVGKVPTAASLDYGQLALNYAAGSEKLYIKNSNNVVVEISGSGGGGGTQVPSNLYSLQYINGAPATTTLNPNNYQTFKLTLNRANTTIALSASTLQLNTTRVLTVIIEPSATTQKVTWPNTIIWAGNEIPKLDTDELFIYIFKLQVLDNGTIYGYLANLKPVAAEFITETVLDSKLADYATKTYVDTKTVNMATKSYVDDAIVPLATTAYVNSAIAGISMSADWTDITGKPTTFAPTIGTTATTAKAGNWNPTWNDVTGKPATYPPTIGTTATTAKAGNWNPTWDNITNKPAPLAMLPIATIPSTASNGIPVYTELEWYDHTGTDWRTPVLSDGTSAIQMLAAGTIRLRFNSGGRDAAGTTIIDVHNIRVLRNGTVVGEYQVPKETNVTQQLDIDVNIGDRISFSTRAYDGRPWIRPIKWTQFQSGQVCIPPQKFFARR